MISGVREGHCVEEMKERREETIKEGVMNRRNIRITFGTK
jgi:hypothetical protein